MPSSTPSSRVPPPPCRPPLGAVLVHKLTGWVRGTNLSTLAGAEEIVGRLTHYPANPETHLTHYPETFAGAEEIVDIATLTGACMIALGNNYAGYTRNPGTCKVDSLLPASSTFGARNSIPETGFGNRFT